MSCGVGQRQSSDPTLLWLWCSPAALAPIQPLAWELPYAMSVALKRKKKKKQPPYVWSKDSQQGCQDYSMGKGQSFQQMMLEKLDIHMQKMKLLDPYLTLYTKTTFKWIKNLNIKAKTIKLLDKNTGKKLH